MHVITTTVRIADDTTVEVANFDLGTQEEVIDFLDEFEGMELGRLYDELKSLGDRTTAFVEPHHRKALRRVISGTARKDGRSPIEGSITITVERAA